jgi:pSer/pThr/pTyr-binding forkhead associated (FHA) protein
MAKLVIKFNNEVIDHIDLKQGDMKIGRKPGCDIFIDNLAISGEHANIFTIGDDSFIQDLGSTNGTFINNKRVTKHHMRNGDTIVIGKHSLVYLSEGATKPDDDFAKTVIINPGARESAAPAPAAMPMPGTIEVPIKSGKPVVRQGALFVLSGTNSGKRIELTKSVTNLGKAGNRSGSINRVEDGYLLKAEVGNDKPKLNGRHVPDAGIKLKNGDIIEVVGTRLQFYLK